MTSFLPTPPAGLAWRLGEPEVHDVVNVSGKLFRKLIDARLSLVYGDDEIFGRTIGFLRDDTADDIDQKILEASQELLHRVQQEPDTLKYARLLTDLNERVGTYE